MMLKPLTRNDSAAFFRSAWDEKVYRYLRGFYCDCEEDAKKAINKLLETPSAEAFVITDSSHPFIGLFVADKHGIVNGKQEVEFSVFIDERYRREGYASQSLKEMLARYPGYRIKFDIDPTNTASRKPVLKFGAKEDKKEESFYIDN
ncbi:MAG: GNAT family N-acetyltransferase [Clostridia bacterium]|nr:GNAT family N-acetyltransferase [Clostridia bacterium]